MYPYCCPVLSGNVPSVMSRLLKEMKFYISLVYGALACQLGTRTWYDRINDKLVLGALPILPHWDTIRLKESISHVISMVEPFEVKSFVLGPREAAERGISYLSLPVEDFVGVPTNDQVIGVHFPYVLSSHYDIIRLTTHHWCYNRLTQVWIS